MQLILDDYRNKKTLHKELKNFLTEIGTFILKDNWKKIKKVNIVVLKDYPTSLGYDKAFSRLYKNGVVNLIITPSYNQNSATRRSLIAHELTHVLQMMTGELKFTLKGTSKHYLYRGKSYTKVYSFAKFDAYKSRKAQIKYISKICPWEYQPSLNADRFGV